MTTTLTEGARQLPLRLDPRPVSRTPPLAQGALKVLVNSPMSPFTGYGNDGIGMVRALVNWGADVYLKPTFCEPPLPPEVAVLMTKPLAGPFDLMIQHTDPDQLGISDNARSACSVTVCWSMWEFTRPAPLSRRPSTLSRRLQNTDLMLWYDQVAADAFAPFTGPRKPVGILQGGYDAGDWGYVDRDWFGERFGFCMHGMLHSRKQPYIAIQAFNELKHEQPEEFDGATLSLHTTIADPLVQFGGLVPKMRVFFDVWSRDVLADFYRANHVLLAPSRGEGKNLPALEFASTGGAVAATNWGGHTMWISGEYAYPLDYVLTPSDARYPDQAHDAKVSVAHMKEVMWHLFTHRDEARKKGELASRMIPQLCDWAVVVEALFRRIRDNVPEKGEVLHDKAMRCRQRQE